MNPVGKQWRMVGGWVLLAALMQSYGVAGAQEVAAVKAEDRLRVGSRADYGMELQRMAGLVEACKGNASACDVKAVPADERVKVEGGEVEFQVRWEWLRAALRKGSGVKEPVEEGAEVPTAEQIGKDRERVLAGASARLGEDFDELTGKTLEAGDAGSRQKVDEVLARREFGEVQQAKWWQLAIAKFAGRIQDWFGRMAGVVPWAPWMGVAFEWGLLAAAAVGLIVWAMRLSKQQRVSFKTELEFAPAWQAESDDWAARAKENAAKGEWREAVHCLYWSAIVMLEGQRLWRQNRARTPREYVGLLEPGSARRRVLGGLTSVFERIWYGIRPATGEDYEKASRLLEELRVG